MTQDEIIEMWNSVIKYAPSEVRITEFAKLVADKAIAELESQEPVATVTSETGADLTMSWWHEPALPIGTKLYTHPPQRTVLQLKEIDRPESASVGFYNRGWNDCLFASGIVKQSQRTWVGLTDDEHCDTWYKESLDWMEYGKAIEAKLREKNSPHKEKNT